MGLVVAVVGFFMEVRLRPRRVASGRTGGNRVFGAPPWLESGRASRIGRSSRLGRGRSRTREVSDEHPFEKFRRDGVGLAARSRAARLWRAELRQEARGSAAR